MNIIKNPIRFGVCFMLVMQFPGIAAARDTKQHQPIADAMETVTAQAFTNVKFYFGDQPHPPIKRLIGTYTTKRTTNGFGKTDAKSCQWAFLSGIKTLYERALTEGGNAVLNIQSITTGSPFKSTSEFVCRAGSVVTKVYLRGDIASLQD